MLVSIVITNYNYASYLVAAIESALDQSYPEVEVIVVDDGSSDNSREIIQSYGKRIKAIFKENGGQCSSCNSGFKISNGSLVIFLDADDVLLKDAVSLHVRHMQHPEVVKSCGYMEVIDKQGKATGASIPAKLAPSGDYRKDRLKSWMHTYKPSFTSGNAWARTFLEKVFPLPEDDLIGPDGYLTAIDTLFGRVESIHEAVAQYRVHGGNMGPINFHFDVNYMKKRLRCRRDRMRYTEAWISRLGHRIDTKQYRKSSDWKLVLMSYTLGLLGEPEGAVPSAMELVCSPFRHPGKTFRSRAFTSFMLVLTSILPQKQAVQLAQYLLLRCNRKRTCIRSRMTVQRQSRNSDSVGRY